MINITRREALGTILGLAGASMISGCATNPVTGKRQLMLMSKEQEIALGKSAHQDIVKAYGTYGDENLQQWFNERGQNMAQVTHRKNLNYTFTVLDSPVINAFAVPGGFIYVTRGILAFFNNEAQFAGVLGHELGHVNARHTAATYSKAKLVNLSIGLGSVFSEQFKKYAQLVSAGVAILFLKYSRDDERQADQLGVEYSSKANYDAKEMSTFFKTLERLSPSKGSLPEWQSTHPDPGDRVVATRNAAEEFQQNNPGMKYYVKRDEYFEVIDGILYGEDPRQGYVKDNVFYHPQMRFKFPLPSGWELTNSPTEVRLSSKDENAILVFIQSEKSDPKNAASLFAQDNGINIQIAEPITVNEMNGYRIAGYRTVDENELVIMSYFIKKENSLFAFHGIASSSDIRNYSEDFTATAYGFDNLTDRTFINVSPKRLEIRDIQKTDSLKNILADFNVPENQQEGLALLNGIELNDSLAAGAKIKIIL